MRSEHEMFDLILGIAGKDERIRAVYMNGSRTNPNVSRDSHQDYDIVYVVTETASFLEDKNWIEKFGEPAMVQEPDSNDLGFGIDVDFSRSYGWLMLFQDGNRIDLHIQIREVMEEEYTQDTLTMPLLDKDGLLPPIPPSNDSGYWLRKPSRSMYDSCCNEFWWCLNNIAKALVRDQMPYAMRMYHETVHVELDKMIEWYIGTRTDFKISVGMWGKYFKKHLPADLYETYKLTYSGYDSLWETLFHACSLFHTVAESVAGSLLYEYNHKDEENMKRYLETMRNDSLNH